ncbi:hypothetical protein AGMMS49944_22510 [Spirochaetia bacterium]|nr:hypothetical protein AGMMS49944_22510 [Spirochaetia bacterium]
MAKANSIVLISEGDRAANIERLAASPDSILDGNAYVGKYELNKGSIRQFLKELKKELLENDAISEPIKLGNTGIDKMLGPGLKYDVNKKLFAHIPYLLKNAIVITDEKPNKPSIHYYKYSHLVIGIELEEAHYTVHIVLGENSGIWYYDHMVSEIEKGSLLEAIHLSTVGLPKVSLSDIKDTTLLRILQAPLPEKNLKGDSND